MTDIRLSFRSSRCIRYSLSATFLLVGLLVLFTVSHFDQYHNGSIETLKDIPDIITQDLASQGCMDLRFLRDSQYIAYLALAMAATGRVSPFLLWFSFFVAGLFISVAVAIVITPLSRFTTLFFRRVAILYGVWLFILQIAYQSWLPTLPYEVWLLDMQSDNGSVVWTKEAKQALRSVYKRYTDSDSALKSRAAIQTGFQTDTSESADTSVAPVPYSVPQSIDQKRESLVPASPLFLEAQNEAANAVFAQTNAPSEAIVGWVADILDRSKDPAWRDYCLQFLGTALERNDLSDSDIRLARATLDATLDSTNAAFAGTALRSLRRAAVTHSDDALSAHVSSNALRIARDTAYSPESRTTALLVLEESAHPDTLATARTILSDSTAAPLLRKTAEAVVKRLETVSQPSLSAIESATMSPE